MNIFDRGLSLMRNHWDNIPCGTAKSMLYVAGRVCIITYIATTGQGAVYMSIVAGFACATIVAIRAFITPFFKSLIAPRNILTFGEEMCRSLTPIFLLDCAYSIYRYQQQIPFSKEDYKFRLFFFAAFTVMNVCLPKRRAIDYVDEV